MRSAVILFLCGLQIIWVLPFFATEPTAIKQTILFKKQALQKASSNGEKSRIFYDLAIAYCEDQEIADAFAHFLEALKYVDKKGSCSMCAAEKEIYEPALAQYLAQGGHRPVEAATELLEKYGEIAAAHCDYLHLNFLIATAYGNVGKYNSFFENFYHAFPFLSDSFLAYKTQGILYLRLSQLNPSMELRRTFQREAYCMLHAALERNTCDCALYKLLIMLAKDEKNDTLIDSYLHGIVEHRAPIPRGDIYFFVHEAVAIGKMDVAQAMIDQARSIHGYSRAISAAQEYLNQNIIQRG